MSLQISCISLTILLLSACASHPAVSVPPATVIDANRPNVCAASVPPLTIPHGSTSGQVDAAHQAHIRELNRIIECFIKLHR